MGSGEKSAAHYDSIIRKSLSRNFVVSIINFRDHHLMTAFDNGIHIAKIRLGINVEVMFAFAVDKSLCFLERRPNAFFQLVQKSGLERFSKEGIVEVFYNTPETVIRKTAFGNEAVNMWVPLQGSPEGVKDAERVVRI